MIDLDWIRSSDRHGGRVGDRLAGDLSGSAHRVGIAQIASGDRDFGCRPRRLSPAALGSASAPDD